MQALNITYFLLITIIIISLFCSDRRVAYLATGITILSAFYQGIINIVGISALAVLAAITYVYFHFPQLNKVIRTLLFTSIAVCFAAFAFHKVPGFFNVIAINKLQLSELSIPFSMYLNFDKVMPALIIFSLSNLYIAEKQGSAGVIDLLETNANKEEFAGNTARSTAAYNLVRKDASTGLTPKLPLEASYARSRIKYTLFLLLSCIAIIIILALTSGYAIFEPKIPSILTIWMINNFFFICFSEEVFFRGFLQKTLQNLLPKQQILAVIIASLIFGATHFQGGLTYIVLSSICGFFYGYTYYKTNKILCSMIVHFGLNLSHLLLFTYPALIKTI